MEPKDAQLAKVELIEKDGLGLVVDCIFSLADGVDTFAMLERRHTRDKIVLKI